MNYVVTLHKALRIRTAVDEKLKSFEVKPVVTLDIDSDAVRTNVSDVIDAARLEVQSRLERYRSLNRAFANLRTAIAAANVANGVEQLLAEQGGVEREINKLKGLVDGQRTDVGSLSNKITRKIEALKAPSQSYGYHDDDTMAVNVLSADDVKGFQELLMQLRRDKERLEDERAAINHRTDIVIGEGDHAALVEHGIV